MAGWISVGLGAAAALCPLPHNGDVTVFMDHSPAHDRLVVCAPDVWVDMGYGDEEKEDPRPPCEPTPTPPVLPPPPAPLPSRPATPPPTSVADPAPPTAPALPAPRPTPEAPPEARPQAVPEPLAAPPTAPVPEDPPPAPSATAPAPAPEGYRWEPRSHYTGGPSRPAPPKLSMTMSTVVVTLPGVLAAAALRPGSRRRSRG